MDAAPLQRFGLSLVVFGGFLDVSARLGGESRGFGVVIMLLGLLVGLVGVAVAFGLDAHLAERGEWSVK